MSAERTPLDITLLKVTLAVGLIALAVLVFRAWPGPDRDDLRAALADLGLHSDDSRGYEVVEDRTRGAVRVLAGAADGNRISVKRVGDLSRSEATAYVEDRRVMLESLFLERQAPYPGQLSATLSCPDAFKPISHDVAGHATLRLLVELYANDRFAYGGCADDILTYHAALGVHVCDGGASVVEVEVFTPRDGDTLDPTSVIRSSTCDTGHGGTVAEAVEGDDTPAIGSQVDVWGYPFTVRWSDGEAQVLAAEDVGARFELRLLTEIPAEHAEAIIDEKIDMFESVFNEFRTGYPGQVTRFIECPEQFKPRYAEKALEGGKLRYFEGYANSNFVVGACAEDLIRYRVLHGHLYCKSGTMVDVDLYGEPDDSTLTDQLLQRIDCDI